MERLPAATGATEVKPYGDGYVALPHEGVRDHTVQDLPRADADLFFASQPPLAARRRNAQLRHATGSYRPSWYKIAENDRTTSPPVQRASAQRMKANTIMLGTSHAPPLSLQPSKVIRRNYRRGQTRIFHPAPR
jgi:hypothetical protein